MREHKLDKIKKVFFALLIFCFLVSVTAVSVNAASAYGNVTNDNSTIGNATNENPTTSNADEQQFFNFGFDFSSADAGEYVKKTVQFENKGSKTLFVTPTIVTRPDNKKYEINKDWITVSPTNATVAPRSEQDFIFGMNFPKDVEGGDYQTTINFNNTFNPSVSYETYDFGFDIKSFAMINLETNGIYDTISAGREYEYKLSITNEGNKDVTIDPKILKEDNYYTNYDPAFNSSAVKISAPQIIKAGETTNMTIKLRVPENVKGEYHDTIDMNVNGEPADNYADTPQIYINSYVFKQNSVPYVKTFKTVNRDPITIGIFTDMYDSSFLQSPKKEDPTFEIGLTCNSKNVNTTLVKSTDTVKNYDSYQSNKHYVETYVAPGAIGDWELRILPKNAPDVGGVSISVGDLNYCKSTD